MITATVYQNSFGQFSLAECNGCKKDLVKSVGAVSYTCPSCSEIWSGYSLSHAKHGDKIYSVQKTAMATVTTSAATAPSLSGPGEAFWDGVRKDWVCNCWAGTACNISACPVLGPCYASSGGSCRACFNCRSIYQASALTNSTLAAPTPIPTQSYPRCQAALGCAGMAEYRAGTWICQCQKTNQTALSRYGSAGRSICSTCFAVWWDKDLTQALVPVTPPTAPTLIPTAGLSLMASASGTLNSLNSQYQAFYGDSDLTVSEPCPKSAALCARCDRELCPELDTYYGRDEYYATFCSPCRRNQGVK